jgi:acyl-CoA synthetase (AMP-forming)/AMP-acid ligase II
MNLTFPDELNLADYYLFDRLREGLGGKTALRFGEHAFTYEEVAERSRAFAGWLRGAGVAREERVYLVLYDTPAFAWSFFGTLAHGAVVTMGNPDAPTDDLAYVLEYVRAAALVTTPRVAETLANTIAASPWLRTVLLVPEVPTGGDIEARVDVPASLRTLVRPKTIALTDEAR